MKRESLRSVIGAFCENRPWLWFLSAVFIFVTVYSACTTDPPLSQNAAIFREETLEGFESLSLKLGPALERDSQFGAAGEVMKDYLLDQYVSSRYVLGLGVLDPSGKYLVGYRIGDTAPGSIEKSGYEEMSFASFKGVEEVTSSRKIVQVPLYFQEQSVLVIGAPLVREDRLLGIMCLSFNTEKFEKEWGISEQEFLKIDFNVE